ncbi:MAG TPA: outer membrane protein assembly factor BamA, partial [Sphingobacterium sp.]|nr:outer membrane protein assembly factor BamA [Sphingobacterium sp.]
YRDATILKDTVIRDGEKNVLVNFDIYEGPKYYVGNIVWTGNAKYSDTLLNKILGVKRGDVFSEEKLNAKLLGGGRNADDISSIYMNDGYLTFSVDPEQTGIYND